MHDPERDIDPQADEYAARTGRYFPVAGLDEPEPKKRPQPEAWDDVLARVPEYPRAVRCIPPPGKRQFFSLTRDARIQYEWPWLSATSRKHVETIAEKWRDFWQTALNREHAIQYRFAGMEVIVEVYPI